MAVRGDFSVRRALYRTYLYRFAVRKKGGEYGFPTIYAHDWNPNKATEKKMFKRWHQGDWNVTGILPFPDMKYIAEVRYGY